MTKKLHLYYFLVLFSILAGTTKAQITSFPYNETFIANAGGWTVQTISGTAWELGTPTAAGTQGAYSAPNCWGTDLDSGYRVNSLSYLKSPKFHIGSLSNPYFSFRQFRYMAQGMDGMYLQYSTDDVSWNMMGNYNCPFATNWYNSTSIYSTSQPAFTGNSNGWIQSGIYLNGLGNNDSIRIRFVFNSNLLFGSAQPGIFIDDIALGENVIFQKDINVLSFISPSNIVIPGNNYPINILIRNASQVAIDTFTCGYYYNGIYTTQQVIHHMNAGDFDTINVGSTTFNTGLHLLCAYATLTNDINHANDSICSAFNSIATLPYTQDFETNNGGWYNNSLPPTSWEYGTPNYGATTGAHSGTKCWDINLDTAYNSNALAYLYTPNFDLTTIAPSILSFWINYNSENYWDGTRIEYSTDGGITWLLLGNVGDPASTNWYNLSAINSSGLPAWAGTSAGWYKASYNLNSFSAVTSMQFRFIFTSDQTQNTDGVSIDDFSIEPLPSVEPQLTSLNCTSTTYSLGATTDNIRFEIKNNGSQTISNISYNYKVNGTTMQTGIYGASILPGNTAYAYLVGFTVTQSVNSVCGYISIANDADTSNNMACISITGLSIYSTPFEDNFDNGNLGWISINEGAIGSDWQLGYPSFGLTTGTHSGNNAWDVNLTSGYASSANCMLYSPLFDLTSAVHPKLHFWQNLNAESTWDGLRIDYKYSTSTIWQTLGTGIDPGTTNWYNDLQLNSSLLPGWTGSSAGWQYSEYPLDTLATNPSIQFRFAFTSDLSINTDGVSIDDFAITQLLASDAQMLSIYSPSGILSEGISTPLIVALKNVGISAITSLSIKHKWNGASAINYNWSGNLLTDSIAYINLGNIIPVGGNNQLQVYTTWAPDLYNGNDTINATYYAIYNNDAGILSVATNSTTVPTGVPIPVDITLNNIGVQTLTNVPISYSINNGAIYNYTWTGFLSPGLSTTVSLPQINAQPDTNHLIAYINWPSDNHHDNDTASTEFYGIVTATLPYNNNFENGYQGWREEHWSNNTKWELGMPAFGSTNSTHSGTACWDINLNMPYFSAANATLKTPYFITPTGGTINISFWLNYTTENNADGLFLEYSTNDLTWNHIGAINDPLGSNWYNSTITQANTAWSGFSNGWKYCTYNMPLSWGISFIELRFKFLSDINIVDSGVSMDDFAISLTTGVDEIQKENNVRVYPNPAHEIVYVACPQQLINETIEIKNTLGQIVYQQKIDKEQFEINVKRLSPGVYYLVTGKEYKTTTKFIKQ